jgi:hypothetical protein
MGLYGPAKDFLIEVMTTTFRTEMDYYARSDVAHTSHAVGQAHPISWTQELLAAGHLTIPPDSSKGDRFVELERTLTVLYCFFLLARSDDNTYSAFVESQINTPDINKKSILSQDNFDKISLRLKNIVSNADNFQVLIYLIIYSDVCKSPTIKQLLAQYPEINLAQNSDGLMTDILQLEDDQISAMLPSFNSLSVELRALLRQAYPIMNACQGHIFFLERGKRTFKVIADALSKIPIANRKLCLDLVNLSQYLDAMGAQGQRNIYGSICCTNVYAEGYALVDNSLQILLSNLNRTNINYAVDIAFTCYLNKRAEWLGFRSSEAEAPLSTTSALMTRLACCIRGKTPEFGKQFLTEFNNEELVVPYHALLEEQMGFGEEGLEAWTGVDYIATTLQNMSFKLFEQANIAENNDHLPEAERLILEAIRQAIKGGICFSMVLKHIAANYAEIIRDPKQTISFGEVAFHATKNPETFNPVTFDATRYALTDLNKVVLSSMFKPGSSIGGFSSSAVATTSSTATPRI